MEGKPFRYTQPEACWAVYSTLRFLTWPSAGVFKATGAVGPSPWGFRIEANIPYRRRNSFYRLHPLPVLVYCAAPAPDRPLKNSISSHASGVTKGVKADRVFQQPADDRGHAPPRRMGAAAPSFRVRRAMHNVICWRYLSGIRLSRYGIQAFIRMISHRRFAVRFRFRYP